MAPRANWKGFLRLSLVTCPVALYPATSESEKVSFNQLNRKTGHRIKYAKVDADTGEEVAKRGYRQGLQGRHRQLHRGDKGGTRERRTGIDADHRDRRVCRPYRDRSALSDPPLLPASGRQGRTRCVRSHPRNHSGDEQGRDRSRGANQPRTHHRAGAYRTGADGNVAALSLRGPRSARSISTIFRTSK